MDPLSLGLIFATRLVDLAILILEKTPADITEAHLRRLDARCKAIDDFLAKLPKFPTVQA